MSLPYSGVTTAYPHEHHPDQPLPPDTPKALRKEWFLDAQWSDLPVEGGSLGAFLCSFDSVHIVSDWPGDIAHLCNFLEWAPGERVGPDRMTFEVRRDLPDTATTSRIPHNALEDARALARGVLAAA